MAIYEKPPVPTMREVIYSLENAVKAARAFHDAARSGPRIAEWIKVTGTPEISAKVLRRVLGEALEEARRWHEG